MRHDKVCTHLYYSICKALGIETTNGTHTCPSQCMTREMSQVESSSTHRQRSYSK